MSRIWEALVGTNLAAISPSTSPARQATETPSHILELSSVKAALSNSPGTAVPKQPDYRYQLTPFASGSVLDIDLPYDAAFHVERRTGQRRLMAELPLQALTSAPA